MCSIIMRTLVFMKMRICEPLSDLSIEAYITVRMHTGALALQCPVC